MNKFEQVSSDGHQVSLTGGVGPMMSRGVRGRAGGVPCLVPGGAGAGEQ